MEKKEALIFLGVILAFVIVAVAIYVYYEYEYTDSKTQLQQLKSMQQIQLQNLYKQEQLLTAKQIAENQKAKALTNNTMGIVGGVIGGMGGGWFNGILPKNL